MLLLARAAGSLPSWNGVSGIRSPLPCGKARDLDFDGRISVGYLDGLPTGLRWLDVLDATQFIARFAPANDEATAFVRASNQPDTRLVKSFAAAVKTDMVRIALTECPSRHPFGGRILQGR